MNHYKISRNRIVKIPEAAPWADDSVQSEDIERVTQKYNLPEKYFLFVGTLEPRKNLIRLVQAFRLFCNETKENYKLLIVGKKSYSYEKIFKEVMNLQLTQQVVFTGHIPEFDLKPIYIRAVALVFPSLLEGFGLTPLEAMVCNIPVICSKKGALGEVIDNACFSIDPEDIQSIKNGMIQIITNPKLREKMIKRGKTRAKKFSWEKSGRKLLKVLEETAA